MRWAARVVLTPVLLFLGLMVSWFGASALDALWDRLGERSHPAPEPSSIVDGIYQGITMACDLPPEYPHRWCGGCLCECHEPAQPAPEAVSWHRRVWRWLTQPDATLSAEERVW
jgi:hypothetical protein